MSKSEELVKGFVRKVDLDYLKGEFDKNMEGSVRMAYLVNLEERFKNKMEDNMEIIAKLIQNPEGKIPRGDDMAHYS